MNNEIQRKITSLTLMTIMLAGGMAIAFPGMEPAHAAVNEHLSVSAEQVGNFAGIQVIEIVVNDSDRSDTSESQGIPNIEINGDDVLMAQGDDGAWYAYVANQQAIDDYENISGVTITEIYGASALGGAIYSGSGSVETYGTASEFLDGFRDLSSGGDIRDYGTVAETTLEVNATPTPYEPAHASIVIQDTLLVDDYVEIDGTRYIATNGTSAIGEFTITYNEEGTVLYTNHTSVNLIDAIETLQREYAPYYGADVLDDSHTVYLTTPTLGAGNTIPTSSNGTGYDITSVDGKDGHYVTINDLMYIATDNVASTGNNTRFGVTDLDYVGTHNPNTIEQVAVRLVDAINADTRNSDIDAEVESDNEYITISARNLGEAGNAITWVSSDADIQLDSQITGVITGSLSGGTDDSYAVNNNPSITDDNWPFIQTYDISDNSKVTITYGTGQSAESVELTYDYDDSKDISLDRERYPVNGTVFITLDDSLLNLSPVADDYWMFTADGKINYQVGSTTVNDVDYTAFGFEEGPLVYELGGVYSLQNTDINSVNEYDENVLVLRESNDDDNVFVNYDRSDVSNVIVTSSGQSSFAYKNAHSVVLDTFNGLIKFTNHAIEEWLSGVELTVQLIDEDRNLNTHRDELISISGGEVPFIKIGEPITIDSDSMDIESYTAATGNLIYIATEVTKSKTGTLTLPIDTNKVAFTADWPTNYGSSLESGNLFAYVNYDLTAFGGVKGTSIVGNDNAVGYEDNSTLEDGGTGSFTFSISTLTEETSGTVYVDIFFFGQEAPVSTGDGSITDNVNRVNDAIYRFELEETADNTATYEGTVEYIMINQLNVNDQTTYNAIDTSGDRIVMIVNDDLDGSDAIRVSYQDVDSTGNDEIISAQEDANTHTGIITVDKTSYSSGNTITVTLKDSDLNTDSDTIQTYGVNSDNDWVGNSDVWLVQLTIGNTLYANTCNDEDLGLYASGITFIETSKQSGVFEGTMKLPSLYCDGDDAVPTNGLDVDFEYQDYSDASGKPNETSSSASITSNTGSVKFERTVYPLPFEAGTFQLYDGDGSLDAADVKIVIQINDPDFNKSASGEDKLDITGEDGVLNATAVNTDDLLVLKVARGSNEVFIDIPESELIETDPESGIFEVEVIIPQRIYADLDNSVIQQGDILSVTYNDPTDASGSKNTVTDSATFDLRNAVLQTDKSVYIVGSDAIITLIEPDLNLDSETAETWSLDLINWDSDAGDVNLSGHIPGSTTASDLGDIFDANPSGLRETGDNTGIFQVVIEIPSEIGGDKLERGEQIQLEYQDWGPAGADYVGDESEDITIDIFTSNFGATVELDQKVYTWTDKVYVTIVAPDHNFDSNAIDEIGVSRDSQINVSTRSDEIENYKLVETGSDTGIFTGEIILTGFSSHDADGDGNSATGELRTTGPTGGKIPSSNDDGLTISFEFSDDEVVLGSALIRWNIGEVQWLEASYPASGTGVIRVIDPDMNLNPEAVDNFDVDVWSDTAAGGINLRVTETNEATGIFEGTVTFTTTDASSGSRLAVSEGDTVTAEYEDNTLPDPYSTADELDITATTLIGALVPPLERAPAANLRAVDAFGNSISNIQIDQQLQVTADLNNGQDRNQDFAYLLQVQDESGVTVSLSWITGNLTPGQSFSPAVSWIPAEAGDYEATVFVWESVDSPTALSPPVSTTLTVS